jgi:hypothetical protein
MSIISKGNLIGKIEDNGQLGGHIAISKAQPNLQNKSVEITENVTQRIVADEGYNGLNEVEITTSVPLPSGTINVTQNGITDVTDYVSANVNVQPNLQNKSVEITTNTTTNISADSGYDGLGQVSVTTNVPSVNLDDYFAETIIDPPQSQSIKVLSLIKRIPNNTNINVRNNNGQQLFAFCSSLVEIPLLDTSNLITMNSMFKYCSSLINVPVLNTSGIKGSSGLGSIFRYCDSLNDTSLNNIMQMCINAINYPGTKTLSYIGLSEAQATRCQSLSNYQALIEAGWTTGY